MNSGDWMVTVLSTFKSLYRQIRSVPFRQNSVKCYRFASTRLGSIGSSIGSRLLYMVDHHHLKQTLALFKTQSEVANGGRKNRFVGPINAG